MQEMRGSVKQPVPGIRTDTVPTGIVDRTGKPTRTGTYKQDQPNEPTNKPATRLATTPMALKIFQKDVEKYQPTPGCRACTEVITGRSENRANIKHNVPHNQDCRARMTELMRQDLEDKERVERAESRQNKFQEELRASRKSESDDDDQAENIEPKSDSAEQNQGPEEPETDVALHVGKRQDEFGIFLNNIQVSLAMAVDERNEAVSYTHLTLPTNREV